MLSDHLLQAAEIFLEGENWARARIVAEYAQTRLGDKGLPGPRWAAVLRMVTGRADDDEIPPQVREAIEAEMAATLADLKEARSVLGQVGSLLGSTRQARESREAAPSATGKAHSPAAASGTPVAPIATKSEAKR